LEEHNTFIPEDRFTSADIMQKKMSKEKEQMSSANKCICTTLSNMPRLTDEKSEADQRAGEMIVKMAEKKV